MSNPLDPTTLHNIIDHAIHTDANGRITVSTTALIRHGSRVPTVAEAHRLLGVAVQAVQKEVEQIETERSAQTDNKTAGQIDFSR